MSTDQPQSLAYHNGAYYVGFTAYILVLDSSSMSQIDNISPSALNSARDIILLNNGQLMTVFSSHNQRLLFFSSSSSIPHSYEFIDYQDVTCTKPHGLFYGNNTYFYLTSCGGSTLYAYSYAGNITS